MVTPKLLCLLKDFCYKGIPTGVTGISQQRQDFLFIGKDSNRFCSLSVLPAVVSLNCNKELVILALAFNVPMVIQPKTPIGIAFVLPLDTPKQNTYQETSSLAVLFWSLSPGSGGFWVECVGRNQPELTCVLLTLVEQFTSQAC